MLHLQTGVHLKEIEIAVAIDDEFHRPGAGIAHGLGQSAGLLTHRLAGGFIQEGRRRLFNHLLVPALDRAFPLVQIDAIAVLVGQHLNFNVARLGDEFLNENPVIAKARRRLVLRRLEALARLLVVPRNPHALATAPGAGLDHHRIADLTRDFHRLIGIGDQAHIARNRRHPGLLGDLLRGDLVPHRLNRGARRADKHHARLFQSGSKVHVFRQEPIARMHRLRAGLGDGVHDLVDHDIRLVRRGRADMHRLIGHRHMQRVAVGVGIDRNRLDPHFAGRLDNAAGNFAPVGDQDFLEHRSLPQVSAALAGRK